MVSRKLKIILLIHRHSISLFICKFIQLQFRSFKLYIVQKLESLRDSFVQISEKRISSNVEG